MKGVRDRWRGGWASTTATRACASSSSRTATLRRAGQCGPAGVGRDDGCPSTRRTGCRCHRCNEACAAACAGHAAVMEQQPRVSIGSGTARPATAAARRLLTRDKQRWTRRTWTNPPTLHATMTVGRWADAALRRAGRPRGAHSAAPIGGDVAPAIVPPTRGCWARRTSRAAGQHAISVPAPESPHKPAAVRMVGAPDRYSPGSQ